MKLNLRLRNGTFTFDVTGDISMSYTKDGNVEIVESTVVAEPTKELEPVVKPVKVEEPNTVVRHVSSRETKQQNALKCLKNTINDKIVYDIRKYLGSKMTDKNFDDIIAAVELYIPKYLINNNVGRCDREQRIRDVIYISMFVIAGVGPVETCDWFSHNYTNVGISITKYNRLAYGAGGGSRFIAEMLWPHKLENYIGHEKDHKRLTVDECQSILEALLKGYCPASISKYFNISEPTVYNVRSGKHGLCRQTDYKGKYPICCTVLEGSDIPVTKCECCGDIIPVKRLLYMPGVKICVNCQDKKEKKSS